jgi:hypothetical protein
MKEKKYFGDFRANGTSLMSGIESNNKKSLYFELVEICAANLPCGDYGIVEITDRRDGTRMLWRVSSRRKVHKIRACVFA